MGAHRPPREVSQVRRVRRRRRVLDRWHGGYVSCAADAVVCRWLRIRPRRRRVLRTRFTDMFGIDHPVMSAPMARHSGGTLAAAVSAAGGLGSFGGITGDGPGW